MGRQSYQGRKLTHMNANVLFAFLLAAALAFAQQATFKVETKLVRLIVSVKNARGEVVGSLERGDFRVFDSGV